MKVINLPPKKLFFTIGEVAKLFSLKESTLRFWENHFPTICPKRQNNERAYTRKEIEEIQKVYFLLKEQKMTISGAIKEMQKPQSHRLDNLQVISTLTELKNHLLTLREKITKDDDNR